MVKFKTGNLFNAPKGSYLAHACNCMGGWGPVIAAKFKKLFPNSYREYKNFCDDGAKPGDVFVCSEENGYRVLCLFTSAGYSARKDSKSDIIEATKTALQKLPTDAPIHMPLINAGQFGVPWENTAPLLIQYDDMDITVWTYDGTD